MSGLSLTTLLEIIGVGFGLLGVLLTIRVNIWGWPVGIVSTASYALLFLHIHLYADALLHLFFVTTGFLGWIRWLRKTKNHKLPISTLSAKARYVTAGMTGFAIFVSSFIFSNYTDAHIPYVDSTASGLGATGQILQMQKKIECWYLWMTVNILSVGIYIYKEVYLTAILFTIYLCLSVRGYLSWRVHLQRPAMLGTAQPCHSEPERGISG